MLAYRGRDDDQLAGASVPCSHPLISRPSPGTSFHRLEGARLRLEHGSAAPARKGDPVRRQGGLADHTKVVGQEGDIDRESHPDRVHRPRVAEQQGPSKAPLAEQATRPGGERRKATSTLASTSPSRNSHAMYPSLPRKPTRHAQRYERHLHVGERASVEATTLVSACVQANRQAQASARRKKANQRQEAELRSRLTVTPSSSPPGRTQHAGKHRRLVGDDPVDAKADQMLHLVGIVDRPDVDPRSPLECATSTKRSSKRATGPEARRDLERDVAPDVVLRRLTGVQPPVELARRLGAGRDAGARCASGEPCRRRVRERLQRSRRLGRPCSPSTPASVSSYATTSGTLRLMSRLSTTHGKASRTSDSVATQRSRSPGAFPRRHVVLRGTPSDSVLARAEPIGVVEVPKFVEAKPRRSRPVALVVRSSVRSWQTTSCPSRVHGRRARYRWLRARAPDGFA